MGRTLRATRPGSDRPHRYSFAGLRVAASRPVPALAPREDALPPDLEIALEPRAAELGASSGYTPWRDHPLRDEVGRPLLRFRRSQDGAWYELCYADATTFRVDREGRRIDGRWTAPNTLEDAATYLVGPVLAFALRRRGALPLHGAAFEAEGGAALLLGAPGAGKSTLAAALALGGRRVLCDDAAVLVRKAGGRFVVQPGSRWIRLWPDSARTLLGPRHELPRVTPGWEKRYLALFAAHCGTPRPLVAVYLLDRETEAGERSRPLLPLAPGPAFGALLGHSYGGFLQGSAERAREFRWLADLAGSVPVLRLFRAPLAELRARFEHELRRTRPLPTIEEERGCTASFNTAR